MVSEQRLAHLEQLEQALASYGLVARVITTRSGPTFLRVMNPKAAGISENVTCATAPGERADYYWWSWGERLHPVDDPGAAAGKVARVLEPLGGKLPGA